MSDMKNLLNSEQLGEFESKLNQAIDAPMDRVNAARDKTTEDIQKDISSKVRLYGALNGIVGMTSILMGSLIDNLWVLIPSLIVLLVLNSLVESRIMRKILQLVRVNGIIQALHMNISMTKTFLAMSKEDKNANTTTDIKPAEGPAN